MIFWIILKTFLILIIFSFIFMAGGFTFMTMRRHFFYSFYEADWHNFDDFDGSGFCYEFIFICFRIKISCKGLGIIIVSSWVSIYQNLNSITTCKLLCWSFSYQRDLERNSFYYYLIFSVNYYFLDLSSMMTFFFIDIFVMIF